MARHAIHRRLLLLVAADTKSHRVIHGAFGHGRLGHVTVARRAIHASANVRCMIKLHMRRWFKAVDTLPRNVFSARLVGSQFLDFRFIGGDHLMTRHAEIDAGYPRIRSLIHSHMAINALQSIREMHFMRICDGLNRFCAHAEEFTHRVHCRRVRGSKYGGIRRRRRRWNRSILSGQRVLDNQRREGDCADNGRNSDPTIQSTCAQCLPTLDETKCYREPDILYIPHSSVNPTFPFCFGEEVSPRNPHKHKERKPILSEATDFGPHDHLRGWDKVRFGRNV
jgi:hypothetical protein